MSFGRVLSNKEGVKLSSKYFACRVSTVLYCPLGSGAAWLLSY